MNSVQKMNKILNIVSNKFSKGSLGNSSGKKSHPSSPSSNKKSRDRAATSRAIVDINIGVVVFFLQDLVIKLVSHDYAISQLMLVRALVAMPLLLVLIARWRVEGEVLGLAAICSPRWRILLLRGMTTVVAYTCYYLAFPVLPIAIIVSMFLTAPLFLALLGFLVIGEPIAPRQLLAIVLGFAGSLIILRPGFTHDLFANMATYVWHLFASQAVSPDAAPLPVPIVTGFDYASLLPLGAAIAYSLSQTINRKFLQQESPFVMAFYQTALFFVAASLASVIFYFQQFHPQHLSLIFLTRDWVPFAPRDLILVGATGIIGTVGMVFLARAYRNAPAAVVAPFEYVALLIGFIVGFLVWNETPDIFAMVGAFMILAAGMLIIRGDT